MPRPVVPCLQDTPSPGNSPGPPAAAVAEGVAALAPLARCGPDPAAPNWQPR